MAMAGQVWPRCTVQHSPNTSCEDLGYSILLLLGLIICVNIGINLVTLLWNRLRSFLHHVFNRIVCEKEASKSSSCGKKTQAPGIHLRCTVDPVKITVTPPPTRRHCHQRPSCRPAHHTKVRDSHTDHDDKSPNQHPAICSHNCDQHLNWENFQCTQGFQAPSTQDAMELPPQIIHFQHTVEGRPLKREMQSELSLQAYVYPVNPPPPSLQALSHKSNGKEAEAGGEQEQCLPAPPAPPPVRGPAFVPDIPGYHSLGPIVYDARDVRRRLRELTREVEALSHCYPMTSRSSTAEELSKDWVYHSLQEG